MVLQRRGEKDLDGATMLVQTMDVKNADGPDGVVFTVAVLEPPFRPNGGGRDVVMLAIMGRDEATRLRDALSAFLEETPASIPDAPWVHGRLQA